MYLIFTVYEEKSEIDKKDESRVFNSQMLRNLQQIVKKSIFPYVVQGIR
uniref:Uncharacterized protein n=1 Tax=Lepeophtheirus salmonis TaxID=72036 RepID=A0A0K2TY12_LEPSM